MGIIGPLFFGEKDGIRCEEIARQYKIDLVKVKMAYGKMLEDLGVKPNEETTD